MPVVALDQILQFPLYLKQGSDITIIMTVVTASGNPITDPAGWTTKAQIRSSPEGPVLYEWNTTPGSGIGTAELTYDDTGKVSTLTLTTTNAQSSQWTWSSAMWDVFLTTPGGLAACVAEGNVSVTPAITH